MEGFIVQSQPPQRGGAHIGQKHIRRVQQTQESFLAVGIFQVDGGQRLAAVLDGKQGIFVILTDYHLKFTGPAHLIADGGFHLDDLRTVGAQHTPGSGSGHHGGQLHNPDALQGHPQGFVHLGSSFQECAHFP